MIQKRISQRIPFLTARFFARINRPFEVYSTIHDKDTILRKLNPDKIPDTKIDYGKLPIYEHKVNYNLEENKDYSKKVEKAKEKRSILAQVRENKVVTRRARRIFNKPLYDTDLTNYDAFVDIKEHLPKASAHNQKVVHKIEISPADLRSACGEGGRAYRNGEYSTREYDFTDSNLDKFLIYDYKSTQEFGGGPMAGYDYENQMHIRPMYRKQMYPTEEDFWNSTEPHPFRVNCTEYAEFRKFKEWLLKKIEEAKNGESFEQRAFKKFGETDTYDDYHKQYPHLTEFAIYKFSKQFYDKKYQFSEIDKPVEAKTALSDEFLAEKSKQN